MIDCKSIAEKRKQELKEYIQKNNLEVVLAVIQVGDDPASNSYIKGKQKDSEEVGIELIVYHYSENVTTEEIIELIEKLNVTKTVNGIIVQLPLPKHLDKDKILNTIDDCKDVDGFKNTSKFTPCTAKGVMMILDSIGVDVDGKKCCVIGRGEVGKSVVDLLTKHDATVIWCNSHTDTVWMDAFVETSDIIISATGKSELIKSVYDQIVIDVGISRKEDGKLYGDVDKLCYRDDAMITPVPNGVGLMTRVALLENTVYASNSTKL